MSEDIKDVKYQILLEQHKELLKQNFELRSKLMMDKIKNNKTNNGDDDMNKETNDLLKEILNTLKNNKCECVSTDVEETVLPPSVLPPSVRFATDEHLEKTRLRKYYYLKNSYGFDNTSSNEELKKKIEKRIAELHKKPFDVQASKLLNTYMTALNKINNKIKEEKEDLEDC